MIRVFEFSDSFGNRAQEYSCPYCNKPLVWLVPTHMSPFACLGCTRKIVDITQIIKWQYRRIAYHREGEYVHIKTGKG